ncbi:MAG: glycosyltransferase family 39 protein [Nostocaceae cyanobacterium]|nr:glycosyltransferase family 39 protein [Nostocaceae cyanobacterium]
MNLTRNGRFDHWLNDIAKRPYLAAFLSILWLLFFGGVAFFWRSGSIGLVDETEPLFAEASRQMTVTGNWITPYFNGETRFDKPALVYWLQAIGYLTIGVNEWAVRLPSALAAMGMVCLGFYTLYRYQQLQDRLQEGSRAAKPWLTANLGAAIMALTPQTIAWARTGVSDMLLVGCMASALLCFYLGYAEKSQRRVQQRWYLAFYILIGLAVLTKGPVGIVLPGLIIGAFLLYLGNFWQIWREMSVLRGLLIVALISIPWYVLVIWQNPQTFIASFFGYHNVERFTSVVNRHSAPWYFYFLVVLVGFAPWSIFLPLSIVKVRVWRRGWWQSQERDQQLGLFALFWFAGVFMFFTIAVTKLPSYVLPLMPAAAILVTLLWSNTPKVEGKRRRGKTSRFLQITCWANVVFLLILGVAMLLITQIIGDDPAMPNLKPMIQHMGLPIAGAVIWFASAVSLSCFILARRPLASFGVNLAALLAFVLLVVMPASFVMDHERQLPLRELSVLAGQVQQPGEEIIMVGFKKPSVVFYSQRPVTFIRRSNKAAEYLAQKAAKRATAESVLILAQPKKFPEMGLQLSQYENLRQVGAYQLIRVKT